MYVILLVVCILVELYCFQRQRAMLEIGRILGFDVRKEIIPPWFIIMWVLPLATMYCISQVFSLAWYFSIPVYAIIKFLCVLLPIKKSFYIDTLDELNSWLRKDDGIPSDMRLFFQISMLYEKYK